MLALVSTALLALALVAWVVLWRRYRHQRYYHALADRIRARFPVLEEPLVEDTVPLRAPNGRVAVRSEGIHLSLSEPDPVHVVVPWEDVDHVLPKGDGDVRVHVAGVGAFSVSGIASRQIWAITNEARTAGAPSLARP